MTRVGHTLKGDGGVPIPLHAEKASVDMRDQAFCAGVVRKRVASAGVWMRQAPGRREVWHEYESAGEVVAFALRCGIVGEREGADLLDTLDAALDAGLNGLRRKSSPTGKSGNSRKIAA